MRRAQADSGPRCAPAAGGDGRSHADAELKENLQQLGEHQTTSIGSSLKFCLVAEGQASCTRVSANEYLGYRRWSCCGCGCRSARSRLAGKPPDYTPRESFPNPGFRVSID
ncbi:hypothetical protein ACNKHL_25775 [Shigella flexneri]